MGQFISVTPHKQKQVLSILHQQKIKADNLSYVVCELMCHILYISTLHDRDLYASMRV
jgi:hypothetical protein